MSNNWCKDISDMHKHYGHDEIFENLSEEKRKLFMEFRLAFLDEELNETKLAVATSDAEEVVDGLIDLCVVALGTLDALGVDVGKAWDAVLVANMAKQSGIKEGRPNPLGLPDLIKPEGWTAPSHEGNHGRLAI